MTAAARRRRRAARAVRRDRRHGRGLPRQLLRLVRGGPDRPAPARSAGATAKWKHRASFLPVIEADCRYRRPARYDDELEIRTDGPADVAGPHGVRVRGICAGTRRIDRHRPHGARGGGPRRAPLPAAGPDYGGVSHEGARDRHGRVHRVDPVDGPDRPRGRGHRARLFHRLLRPGRSRRTTSPPLRTPAELPVRRGRAADGRSRRRCSTA